MPPEVELARKFSKQLVIDASVARASGGHDATYPASKMCRDFLLDVLSICHRVVMTPEISLEWKKHQSFFAQTWLVSMRRKGKIEDLESQDADQLLEQVLSPVAGDKAHLAIKKDIHLVIAALMTDNRVASLDDTVRRLLMQAALNVPRIKKIVWINPAHDGEQPQKWLAQGATADGHRMLHST